VIAIVTNSICGGGGSRMPNRKQIVPLVVEAGKPPVWIELSDEHFLEDDSEWVFAAQADEKTPLRSPKSLKEAFELVRPLVELLHSSVSKVTTTPSEIELNIGFKLSNKVGIVIAESNGEASFGMKLKWNPEPTKQNSGG